jgi:hypothetical protein
MAIVIIALAAEIAPYAFHISVNQFWIADRGKPYAQQ